MVSGPDGESAESLESSFNGISSNGVVYTMSNDAAANEIVSLYRAADGTLTQGQTFDTGGLGTSDGLGNQGGLRGSMSKGDRYLFVCNAGSNDISVLACGPDGLDVVDVEPSGGERPISVTVNGDLVYVLNAGGEGNIAGFRFHNGRLHLINRSSQPLSGAGVGPAQIEFSPDGRLLVVTEKATNQIVTYRVRKNGRAEPPMVNASVGQTPFGFAFDGSGKHIVVSEAFGGGADQSAVSSYSVGLDGSLSPVAISVPTTETAACWVAFAGHDRYAYTTNAGSGTITGYLEDPLSGELTILDADGVTADTGPGSTPLDLASAGGGGEYLYVLAAGTGEIAGFAVGDDGSLSLINRVAGLPANVNGLVAW
jgi:6-phosphogluconolactonase